MSRTSLIVLVIAALGLTACSSAGTPEHTIQIAAEATHAATPVPTVSVPTAMPTKTRPPATPTPTRALTSPTPSPTPTAQVYVVQEFDTLLGIAIEAGITVEALVAANDLNENDFLQIGRELIIPTSTEIDTTTTAEGETTTTADDEITPTAGQVDHLPTESLPSTPPATSAASDESVGTAAGAETSPTEVATVETALAPAPPSPAPVAGGPPPPTISHAANINPLTGLPVDDPAKLRRRPLMVRIGNDVAARQSQVGLNSADVVYEEIAEWWVTRFTAIFLSQIPGVIGPVRSARLINVQLVPQYQGALAHSGGSDPVRWEISQAPIANLDEYYNARPYFYRPNEGWQTRLVIDGQAAYDYMAAKGLLAPVTLQGFLFSDAVERGQPGENIYIPYPRATSFTEWHYDAAGGQYLRWIKGSPLYDVNGGQIAASNVIVYFAEHQATDIVEDSNGLTSIRVIINGKGPAWFFRDGKLNKGFWETDGARTPYFGYEDGRPYSLKPGNTWVEVVPTYFTIGLNSPDEASSRP